ncbi:MAG: monomeric [FeFe] hydrogenase [Endomicrobiaceae bacterium]|nr:monomeric [FeFe] hydrogenase [Endomicrobiaceae bacterium]
MIKSIIMIKKTNYSEHFRMEVLEEICYMFFNGNLDKEINHLPFNIIPKGSDNHFRCCVYKERAILKLRTLAAFGYSVNEIDEALPLTDFLLPEVEQKYKTNNKLLTVLESACSACVKSRYMVSEICQGCLSRKCASSCPFNAITISNFKAHIDQDKCKNCGKCLEACPYNAILKIVVPCEDVCPVNAITKDDKGRANIDHSLCISCGKCIAICPFGAIMERRQILDVLRLLSSKKLAALVAPSIIGQFGVPIENLVTALKEIGFEYVYEVALGADITAKKEATEFKEKVIEEKQEFMTTSCCHAYVRLIKKHIPKLKQFVSETLTPMHYTAEIAKNEHPDCLTVFIGPCLSKRKEAQEDNLVDYVLTFQELKAMISTKDIKDIDILSCNKDTLSKIPTKQARQFAIRGGVSEAVRSYSTIDHDLIKTELITDLDKKNVLRLSAYANGHCQTNLIEVMACKGGCIGGCNTVSPIKQANEDVIKFS